MSNTNQKITTFLMFEGKAEEAMNFYTSLFDQSEIVNISRYDENKPITIYSASVNCQDTPYLSFNQPNLLLNG